PDGAVVGVVVSGDVVGGDVSGVVVGVVSAGVVSCEVWSGAGVPASCARAPEKAPSMTVSTVPTANARATLNRHLAERPLPPITMRAPLNHRMGRSHQCSPRRNGDRYCAGSHRSHSPQRHDEWRSRCYLSLRTTATPHR